MKSIFLIDPLGTERKFKTIKTDDHIKSMHEWLGGYFTTGWRITPKKTYLEESGITSFDVLVNDEALLNPVECFFQVITDEELSPPLAGKAVIVATNEEGETVDIDPNWIIFNLKFSFISKNEKEAWNEIREFYKKNYGSTYEIEEL